MKRNKVLWGFLGKEISSGKFNKDLLVPLMEKLQVDSAAFMEQTHSDNISIVCKKHGLLRVKDTDGMLTEDSSFLLMGTFADCVPVYYYHKDLDFVALVHSGWRGTQSQIPVKMLNKILTRGHKEEDIRVIIGPGISQKHYEVGEEFIDYFPGSLRFTRKEGKLYFHVAAHIYDQLCEVLEKKHIYMSQECTYENPTYHSFRRDGEVSGRNIGYIMIEESTLQK